MWHVAHSAVNYLAKLTILYKSKNYLSVIAASSMIEDLYFRCDTLYLLLGASKVRNKALPVLWMLAKFSFLNGQYIAGALWRCSVFGLLKAARWLLWCIFIHFPKSKQQLVIKFIYFKCLHWTLRFKLVSILKLELYWTSIYTFTEKNVNSSTTNSITILYVYKIPETFGMLF